MPFLASSLIFGICLYQATEIGKAVTPLRKHGSTEIRQLARTLIEYELFSPRFLFTIHISLDCFIEDRRDCLSSAPWIKEKAFLTVSLMISGLLFLYCMSICISQYYCSVLLC